LTRHGDGRSRRHRVRLEIGRVSDHVYQLLTGLLLLARDGFIDLDLRFDPRREQRPSRDVVEATIDDVVRVFYEALDGYNLDRSALETSLARGDLYFKRSSDERRNAELAGGDRIRPYGLNYPVALLHPLFMRLEWASRPRAARPREGAPRPRPAAPPGFRAEARRARRAPCSLHLTRLGAGRQRSRRRSETS
jgi:hypothetical protein